MSSNLTSLFTSEFSSSTKQTTIARFIVKHSIKISFSWMKLIYAIVMKKTMLCIITIDYECSSMFSCSLIFSEKFMNFQRQIILNLIAWRIYYVEIIVDSTCAKSFVDTCVIVMNVNELKFSKIARTIYSFSWSYFCNVESIYQSISLRNCLTFMIITSYTR